MKQTESSKKALRKSVLKVREIHNAGEDEIIDVDVSFDGTWLTRGFSSLYGIGAVIEVATGLVIDFVVLSLHCGVCSRSGLKGEALEEFRSGDHSTFCQINFAGTSGGMEAEIAKQLWTRSIETNNMRHTTMVSDGDSKAFTLVRDLGIYEVKKEECLNHVSKRLGTALRKLKTGGRGDLTAALIKRLQGYYSNAVRDNSNNLEEMKKAIWAAYYHGSSTDAEPQHQYCSEKWCFFLQAELKNETPPSHQKAVGSRIRCDLQEKVKEVYTRLSSDSLLKRCLKGVTQNSNEALHSVIWSIYPKIKFAGKSTIETTACIAIMRIV